MFLSRNKFNLIYTLFFIISVPFYKSHLVISSEIPENDSETRKNTVFVMLLCRNKAHTLPYFLTMFEELEYPKDRIALWIRTDHNVDETALILQTWTNRVSPMYHSVNLTHESSPPYYYPDEKGMFHWSDRRFENIIRLRQEGLDWARFVWADYIWFLDCDVFLTSRQTLNILIKQQKTVVAPMLQSVAAYSNYWCGMTDKFYYARTADYLPILERKKKGCFAVPMVHSAHLVDLRKAASRLLTFDPERLTSYTGPYDDIITFAYSAKLSEIEMFILNTDYFGFITTPLDTENTLDDDKMQMLNIKMEILVSNPLPNIIPDLQQFVPALPESDKLGFDEAYLINLLRRPDRRVRMLASFKELGIETKILNAVDGKLLNSSFIKSMGIEMLPQYKDPYHKRPMTMGELGCFLSHYYIWKEVVDKQLRAVIVFEDDIRFEPYFRRKLNTLMQEVQNMKWDLIYIGRKRLLNSTEPAVDGTSLVWVDYSYWTLCYVLSLEGAQKLLQAQPLTKVVPVDEFLPIMFNKHPEETWMKEYPNRNLIALSAAPLLVYPTHYTGEEGYISDTEDSIAAEVTGPPLSQKPTGSSSSAAHIEL